jgi:hypothetical protein
VDTAGPALSGNNQQHIQQVRVFGWLGGVVPPQICAYTAQTAFRFGPAMAACAVSCGMHSIQSQ